MGYTGYYFIFLTLDNTDEYGILKQIHTDFPAAGGLRSTDFCVAIIIWRVKYRYK